MACVSGPRPHSSRLRGPLLPLMLFAILCVPAWGWSGAPSTDAALADRLRLGYEVFQHGNFAQAVQHWQAAAEGYARDANPHAQGHALIRLGQAYHALGHYHKALDSLTKALALAEQTRDPLQRATALGSLGNVHIATGDFREAETLLQQAFDLSTQSQHAGLAASVANNRGNLSMTQANPRAAQAAYELSAGAFTCWGRVPSGIAPRRCH